MPPRGCSCAARSSPRWTEECRTPASRRPSPSRPVVSDPPRVLDTDLARKQVAALDQLPRPTLVTCRVGPRSSALAYLYAGLRAGASADQVLARGEADAAAFIRS